MIPTVSVIIPSYNHEKFVKECIESVLAQTFQDFEIIITDDGSTDRTVKIIKSFRDPRIKLFVHTENRGACIAANNCINHSTGKYIAMLSSDDAWYPEKLEKQVAFLDNHPEIGAVFTNAMIVGEEGEPFEDKSNYYYNVFDQPNRGRHEWLNYFFYHGNVLCHTSILIRKICYEKCGLYRHGLIQIPDFDMWVRLCLKYEIHVMPEKLVRFRILENMENVSSSRKDNNIRIQFEFIQVLDHYRYISTYSEMVKIFPTAQKYYRSEGFDAQFVLAMVALETKPYKFTELFGLKLLFDALNNPSRAGKIRKLYDFDIHKFKELSGAHDVFSFDINTQLAETQAQLAEKDQAVQALSAQLAEGERAAQAYVAEKERAAQAYVAEKEQQAQAQTAQVGEKERAAQAYVAEKEQQAQALTAQVGEKERAAQAYVAEKEQRVQALTAQVVEKDQKVQALSAQVVEKEQHVQALTAQVVEKDQKVQALSVQVAEEDRSVQALSALVAEKDQTVQALSAQVADGEQAARAYVAEKEQQVQALTAQVGEITSSRAWRLTQLLRRMRGWLVLHGSRRERLARAFVYGRGVRGRSTNRRAKPAPRPFAFDQYIQSEIEIDIPATLVVGRGNYIYISGWCFHPDCRIRRLSLRVGEREYAISNFGYARLDILQHFQNSLSLSSGFWALAPIMPVSSPQDVEISVLADLGIEPRARIWSGQIHVLPAAQTEKVNHAKTTGGAPLVAICMATDNPPLDLFLRQVNSLRNQTHTNWVCIVNDDCSNFKTYNQLLQVLDQDERFIVFRNETRLGRYHNVERVLERVPENVEFVALCDQEGDWYPEKLSTSLQAFRSGKDQLVYSDMDIVTRDGQRVSHMYGNRSHNNYRSLEVLLFSNKAIGAVSIFRRSLLEEILPFPSKVGDIDHDYWVACVALAKGRIRHINRPLYSHGQPGNNAYVRQQKVRDHALLPEVAKLPGWLRSPSTFRTEMGTILRNLETAYFNYLIRLVLLAKLLRTRISNMATSKRVSLQSIASAENSILGLCWQAFKYFVTHRPSLGYENLALRSFVSHHLLSTYYKRKGVRLLGSPEARSTGAPANQPNVAPSPLAFEGSVNLLRQGTEPVPLAPDLAEPERVNFFMATINFKYVFGGYIAMFNLARSIAKSGRRTRIVLVEPTDYNLEEWKREIVNYPGIEDLFELVETSYQYDRSKPLPVNPADIFVATSCWTAHIAWRSAQQLGDRKIIFFAQEYEPIFFNASSYYAFSRASYFLPQFTIFSTELLREYFKLNHIGVYTDNSRYGDKHSLVFENAINTFQVSVRDLQTRKKKKFLFYARPEPHAARNLFELGIIGLSEAIRAGIFNLQEWEFYGIGIAGNMHKIRLDGDVFLTLLPKVSLKEYKEILPAYDLGMSLMLSPHPSLVPLEMAAAGMVTVTTTYENKTPEKLTALSANLIGVPPTVDGLKMGLAQAVKRMDDYEARIAGAQVHWATNWEQAFNADFMKRLNEFLSLANRP
jgi:glycosyltransferase involved in cell wall biosynthesis